MSYIYIIKNTINNKIYIGQTKTTANKRLKKHLSMIYSNGCSALYSAFKKYGKENFYTETLLEGEFDINKLNILEKEYIKNIILYHQMDIISPLEEKIVKFQMKQKKNKVKQ